MTSGMMLRSSLRTSAFSEMASAPWPCSTGGGEGMGGFLGEGEIEVDGIIIP